jgi:hypothetical protein
LLIEWHHRYFLLPFDVLSFATTMMNMTKQSLLLGLMLWCLAAASSAQIRQEIDKAKKDPQTAERAAKADARLVDLKKVTDVKQHDENNCLHAGQKLPAEKKVRKKKS